MQLETMDDVIQAGPELLGVFVNSNGDARHHLLSEVLATLTGFGFSRHKSEPFGPPDGRQIFYKNGLVTVRIKTKGDGGGPRKGQPHMSFGVTNGVGDQWKDDRAKLNLYGRLAAKSFVPAERFQPIDHDGNEQTFVMIQGGLSDSSPERFDAWADRTHFNFPSDFRDDTQ